MTIAKKRKPQRGILQDRLVMLRGEATQVGFAANLTRAKKDLGLFGKGGKEINASRVSEWESGKVGLSEDALRVYAHATGVSLDWLVLGVDATGTLRTDVVSRGQRMTAPTLRSEIAAEAKRRVMRRVALGEFDNLGLRPHGPTQAQIRALVKEWEPTADTLLAQTEQAAIAMARTYAAIRAWELTLAKRTEAAERCMGEASRRPVTDNLEGLAASLQQLDQTALDLLNESRILRFKAEWTERDRVDEKAMLADATLRRRQKREERRLFLGNAGKSKAGAVRGKHVK